MKKKTCMHENRALRQLLKDSFVLICVDCKEKERHYFDIDKEMQVNFDKAQMERRICKYCNNKVSQEAVDNGIEACERCYRLKDQYDREHHIMTYLKIKKTITHIRQRLGWTQRKAAELLKITPSAYANSYEERGRGRLGAYHLIQYLRVMPKEEVRNFLLEMEVNCFNIKYFERDNK